ncbi:MAG: CocE/NonD family hydrolase [Bryobacteraceae bacterium]|nr:CocE/NonD family hydrolase [Bryobacteraceae bacterium]
MRSAAFWGILTSVWALGQTPPATAPASTPPSTVREFYSKYEHRIAMRDGTRLFTSVYIPKDAATDGKTYPIMLMRTPYNVAPYGPDQFKTSLGPSEAFEKERFIFVYQDVRGRFMSEGTYVPIRPYQPNKGPKDFDESSDAYDTIDWLVKNIPGNTGKVGIWGISQPGFFAAAALVDAHPALVAASPQAPVIDYYLGDDVYHNGAFMLAHRFRFYMGFKARGTEPAKPPATLPFDYGTTDGYEFFLNLGSLANADEKYFKGTQPYWKMNVEHTNYDDVWKSRAIWKHMSNIKPATMTVGGWFDTEDPQGPLRQFAFMEKNSPPASNLLVMGPWTHGGFARGDGDRVGNVNFGAKTGLFYRQQIEFPFFLHHLKGRAATFPRAWVFETGANQWRKFDVWPPKAAKATSLFLAPSGALTWDRPANASQDEYLADPQKPVPYIGHIGVGVRGDYMTEDQRFAATRPDVLVYKTPILEQDVTVMGPIQVDLKVSTTGTDSDFVVKLIDVYPMDYPDYNAPPGPAPALPPANKIQMGGYQQLVRGEPFRGKFRQSFEKPVPFVPNQPERLRFQLPDIAHTFRAGHRIMVQVQSSWFPLTDRNPQTFTDIPNAKPSDFVKATQRVFIGGADGSRIELMLLP